MEPDEARRLQPGDHIKLRTPAAGYPRHPVHDRIFTVKRIRLSGEEIETEEDNTYQCWQIERVP